MPCISLSRYYREVLPGEIVKISRYDVQTLDVVPRPEGDPSAFCIFEYVYFARPDSIFEGKKIQRTKPLPIPGDVILENNDSRKDLGSRQGTTECELAEQGWDRMGWHSS